jgi:hypothetical protein
MIEGSAAGIVTLMAITVVVLGGLGAFLLFLRRQARRAAMPAGGDAAHGRS